jgi:D-sedoheptulose 7-phosphate isomerase
MFCGNGGSASDSIHLATEWLVRLRGSVNRQPLPAIALAIDQASLSAYANDFGIEGYFENMVSVLGASNDILFALSTSGKSPNIVRAVKMAKTKGIYTVGFLGCGGGTIAPLCDASFIVPSNVTSHIQEAHITAGHAILIAAEDILVADGTVKMRTHS